MCCIKFCVRKRSTLLNSPDLLKTTFSCVCQCKWVIPEKIHTPRQMANWKFSQEGGLIAQEIQAGGGSEPENSSLGVTFNFNLVRYILTT